MSYQPSDDEKVRMALEYGADNTPALTREPVYIWSNAEAALDRLTADLAECREVLDDLRRSYYLAGNERIALRASLTQARALLWRYRYDCPTTAVSANTGLDRDTRSFLASTEPERPTRSFGPITTSSGPNATEPERPATCPTCGSDGEPYENHVALTSLGEPDTCTDPWHTTTEPSVGEVDLRHG